MNLQVLRTLLTNCFKEADKNSVTSLAIPPIGVGGLGFDPRLVASVMREELFEFSRRNPQASLREVRFVVYQKDNAVFQVGTSESKSKNQFTIGYFSVGLYMHSRTNIQNYTSIVLFYETQELILKLWQHIVYIIKVMTLH